MSGLEEIKQWVTESGIEPDYDTISEQFENDNRLPLDDILKEQKGEFQEWLNSQKPQETSIIDSIFSFIKGLFR